jgi:hypothetical protein
MNPQAFPTPEGFALANAGRASQPVPRRSAMFDVGYFPHFGHLCIRFSMSSWSLSGAVLASSIGVEPQA